MQTRPFASPIQKSSESEAQPPTPESLEKAEAFGYNGASIPLFAPEPPPPIQAKLTIGEPGDKYEEEADEVADRVVDQINIPQPYHSPAGETVQREEDKNKEISLKLVAQKSSEEKHSALAEVIEQLLGFFKPLGEFVAGSVYQWLYNNGQPARWLLQILLPGWNGLEQDVEQSLPQSWAFAAGQNFGDGAAIVTGLAEIVGGGGLDIGGGSLCLTGVGCIAGAPAIVAATALQIHGAGAASSGLANIIERLGVSFSMSESGNSDSSGRQLNWSWKSRPTFGHTFDTHGQGSKNTRSLRGRAASTGESQGQWLNNETAANFLRELRSSIQNPTTVEIPSGFGQVILPDGSIVPATHALVVPKSTGGYITSYPIVK